MKTNKFFILFIISIFYFFYISFVIKPWTFNNFSLVDDGQVLTQNGQYLDSCIKRLDCSLYFDQTFELGTYRFRPAYWIINGVNQIVLGNRADLHHIYRAYVIGYLSVILLALILLRLKINYLVIVFTTLIFMTSFSFSENIIRLGTNEPYQVIFLALFSIMYLCQTKNRVLMIVLLVWAPLIKENNIAILPAILFTEFLTNKKFYLNKQIWLLLGIPFLVFVAGSVIGKFIMPSTTIDMPVYTSNYVAGVKEILNNSQAISAILFSDTSLLLVLIFPFLLLFKDIRNALKNKEFIYWVLFSVFSIVILTPWKYVLDRYYLVGIFGLNIVMAYIVSQLITLVRNRLNPKFTDTAIKVVSFNIVVFLVMSNIFFRGLPINIIKTLNYRNWFEIFTNFEKDQVMEIAKYNNDGVYLNMINNLDSWEFLYEIPIHLKLLYGIDPNTEMLGSALPKSGVIFSRPSLDMVFDLEKLEKLGYKKVESKSYSIDQVDPQKLKNEFSMRPIQTIFNPPFKKESLSYYWEIRYKE